MNKLHQILSTQHLGFSLDDIKNRLVSLDTPADVAKALTEQADTIRIRTDLGEEIHQSGDIGVDLPALLEDLKRRGTAVRDIQIDRGTLERYFIDMTRGDGR